MFALTKTQLATARSIAVNCASIIFATLIIGMALTPAFNLQVFLLGCILFFVSVAIALNLEK